jgi:hypothetical protein
MEQTRLLKLLPRTEKEEGQVGDHLDPLVRFRGVVSNLTKSALDCLNRISQREMQKNFPSPTLMEDYFLLHHYLDFIERLCRDRKDSSSSALTEEYLFLHESMHFE